MSKVLITGFGAYAEETENPSGTIAWRLNGSRIDGHEICGVLLPVDTVAIHTALATAIKEKDPDIVVLTGVAPGRTAPTLERVAINVRDFPIPDIGGRTPIDEPVAAEGPVAYLNSLPIKAILQGWRDAGIPGYVSNTAGTYLCNQTAYLAHHLTRTRATRVGFIHVPTVPTRAAQYASPLPSMPVEQIEEAVSLAVSIAARHDGPDLPLGAGAIS
ncbi:pyrrolidone-carboxylate peptidase [Mycobacteroides abscessus subsp. bolletii]|uniref:pyroglutamyl-peptidase I family protein n=1 Tax=Mycobacteroides abscessus TaxID=36809 RepID=UPI0009A8D57B|nr:peptidase C15 [Mycobacteroides abscessus]SKY48414.1 pyrrolidone-carboxylate peptidase [Mycobacteroides abscessus subsp. bolletii]